MVSKDHVDYCHHFVSSADVSIKYKYLPLIYWAKWKETFKDFPLMNLIGRWDFDLQFKIANSDNYPLANEIAKGYSNSTICPSVTSL